ncbi:hypothetical protein Desti_2434 [Desulfomonile tiedjei DSM 6799]|uniref:DUF5666 domain-containing protein n=2 Tax=Desulfomonile tiedjei TaxID=2358 RepID=I4C6C5_DESTA|nr:hypothetical protein Desti_2434 [Desulfomonile tiedjei DSM 6799]
MRVSIRTALLLSFFMLIAIIANGAPIQIVDGVIVDVKDENVWIVAKGDAQQPRKFLLRWNARFDPPRLPLKGDRVRVLYKDKDEGAVIYGLNYLQTPWEVSGTQSDSGI